MTATLDISLEFLQELLGGGDPPVTVTDFQISTGSGRGDNYTATLYRLLVKGHVESTGASWSKSIICKCLPVDFAHRQAFKSDALFRNEVEVYTRVIPALIAFQKSTGRASWQGLPRCLLAREDLLVLEDLAERGFRMADRRSGLDLAHCMAALRELATLHALSLAMKQRQPEVFNLQVAGAVRETLFVPENNGWYRDYYRSAATNVIEMVMNVLPDNRSRDVYVQKLRDFVCNGDFFGRMVALVSPREPLAVLCHGDCWTNNLLFRYSDAGEILEVCLIDFQLARYASPALDLSNLLYVCTTRTLRAEHGNALLREYHASLVTSLASLNCHAPAPDALWTMLQAEMRRCGRFGLGLALDMVPISTCENGRAPELMDGGPVWAYECNEECARRMADLVQDLVDNGQL